MPEDRTATARRTQKPAVADALIPKPIDGKIKPTTVAKKSLNAEVLTVDYIRKEIDRDIRNRPPCSDAVAKAALKSNCSEKQIALIGRCLNDMSAGSKSEHGGVGIWYEALKDENQAALFVMSPEEFVKIAKAAKEDAWYAFGALGNSNAISKLFLENPKLVSDAFIRIIVAKRDAEGSGGAFMALSDKKLSLLFVQNPELFVRIAKATRLESMIKKPMGEADGAIDATWRAFEALENDDIAKLFIDDPRFAIDVFASITEADGKNAGLIFQEIAEPDMAKLFIKKRNECVELIQAVGKGAWLAINALRNKNIAKRFLEKPKIITDEFAKITRNMDEVAAAGTFNAIIENEEMNKQFLERPKVIIDAFVAFAKVMGKGAGPVFYTFTTNKENLNTFIGYCNKKIPFNKALMAFISSDSIAIELGRPLDDLHSKPLERKKYLDELTTVNVFALLISNPEYFYTSTNHMLFDRLKKDLGNKTITQFFKEYSIVETEMCRNFLFRAITYDRFYGEKNSLLGAKDVNDLLPILTKPLEADKFDMIYFFRLANAFDKINAVAGVKNYIKKTIEMRIKLAKDSSISSAMEYISYISDNNTALVPEDRKRKILELDKKEIFNPELYKNRGKITVLQIFDKKDTEKDHWLMTQKWFEDYFGSKPVNGPDGEIVYENKTAKMVLYMGEDDQKNQAFLKKRQDSASNMIVTFRGHSYSLEQNLPSNIFNNRKCNILFIPGSCGSASSTPRYIEANPNTDLRFISNTSTGRGQVTNAILEILLKSKEAKFKSILSDPSSIGRVGGDLRTLKIWSRGEALIKYVQNQNPAK